MVMANQNQAIIRMLKSLPGDPTDTKFLAQNQGVIRWLETLPSDPDQTTYLRGDMRWRPVTELGGIIGVGELYITPDTRNPADILGYGTWEFLGTATKD
jgi:hypothetical protein